MEEEDYFRDEDFFEEPDLNLTMGYQEFNERAAAGADVSSRYVIEGKGALARMQQMQEKRQVGTAREVELLNYFRQLRAESNLFGPDSELHIFDTFRALKHPNYKNSKAFLIAYIFKDKKLTRADVIEGMRLAKATQAQVSEADIIRYHRLLSGSSLR